MLLSISFCSTIGLRAFKHMGILLQLCEYSTKTNKASLFVVRMTSQYRLDDSLRWRAICRLEAGQSQAEVAQ
ncbi:hypothetical protein TNCV_2599151 [Trichonephila clavipes]|nr:hypothetical protein TNCV_2599151 [Trichonephila clavipes]